MSEKHHHMPGHLCCPPNPMITPPMLLAQGSLVNDAEPLPTPLIFQCGGKKYQILPVTTASQVITDSGTTVENRLGILERAMANNPSHYEVATIIERNDIRGLHPGDTVYVADATDDSSVSKGGAEYVYNSDGTWRKCMEDEAMDHTCIALCKDGSLPESLRDEGILNIPVDLNSLI